MSQLGRGRAPQNELVVRLLARRYPRRVPAPRGPFLPFSTAWVSERLYRVTADLGSWGRAVEVDGWDDALDTAWQQLGDACPELAQWVDDYHDACGEQGLSVTFRDVSRIVGRRGYRPAAERRAATTSATPPTCCWPVCTTRSQRCGPSSSLRSTGTSAGATFACRC